MLFRSGTPDDPYAEPFHWSPDSRHLVVLQTRKAQEHKVCIVESSPRDQLQPKLQTLDYLKPGDRVAHPRPRLFDLSTRKLVSIDESLFSNPWDLDSVEWQPDSQAFTFLYNQRGHQVLQICSVDAVWSGLLFARRARAPRSRRGTAGNSRGSSPWRSRPAGSGPTSGSRSGIVRTSAPT